jgi:hypothetical protein
MFHAQQRAEHVGVEGGGEAFGGLFRNRARRAFSAGVVDGHIQAAEPLHGSIDQLAHFFLVAHISANEFCLRTQLPHFGGKFVALFVVPAGHNHTRAFRGKGQRRGPSDSCQRASD